MRMTHECACWFFFPALLVGSRNYDRDAPCCSAAVVRGVRRQMQCNASPLCTGHDKHNMRSYTSAAASDPDARRYLRTKQLVPGSCFRRRLTAVFLKRIDRGRFGSLSSLQDDRHPPAHPYLFFPFFIKSLVKMWKYIFLMYIYRRDKSNVPGSFNIVTTYIEVIPRGIPKRGVEYMGVLYFLKNSCLKS